jgi:hypothetical protein
VRPQKALLIDLPAERGLVATMLENITPAELDPMFITSDMIRILFLTAQWMQNANLLLSPKNYGDAETCAKVRDTNAEIVAHQIDLIEGLWPGADSPRWTLFQCCQMASLPWLSDEYIRRIKQAALRRQMLERSEELRRLALSPCPIDEEMAR